jgi:hypothetical protein
MATPGAAIESASRAHTKPLLLPSDRWSALEIAFWLIPVVAFFAFPNYRVLGSQVLIIGLFAVSLDLILGYAGIVSLGHAAFFGIGAYTAGLLAVHGWHEPISGLVGAAIVAAIATLKGPFHGGAAEAVQKTVEEIGDPERAIDYVKEKIEAGEKVMGFGHRVYKTEDPRAHELRGVARDLGHKMGNDAWFQILQEIEKAMEPYRPKGIYPNVDFYAGAVYSLLGIPDEQFIPMFAVGRMPGWVAHVLEQYEDNVLIRPLLEYTGPRHLKYVPLEKR